MAENTLIYQVIPTYKNIPQIMFIKQFENKDSAIEYAESIKEILHDIIYHKIDESTTKTNKEKVFESLHIYDNLNFIYVGINDLEKNNKLYTVVVDSKGKKKFQTLPTSRGTELPLFELIQYKDTTVKLKEKENG